MHIQRAPIPLPLGIKYPWIGRHAVKIKYLLRIRGLDLICKHFL